MCKSVEVLKNTECAYLEAVRVDSSRKFDGGGKREESDRKKKKKVFFQTIGGLFSAREFELSWISVSLYIPSES